MDVLGTMQDPLQSMITFCIISLVLLVLTRGLKQLLIHSMQSGTETEAPIKFPHKDPIFGLDLLLSINRSLKNQTFLSDAQMRFKKLGRTYQSAPLLGTTVVHTIEPKNIQTVYALSFEDFGLEPLRRNMAIQLWGRGILSTDGAFWHHSRALIRPTFNREQISSIELLRPHLDALLTFIPRDGSTIDLIPLLKRYTLDTSSEILFGKSVKSQSTVSSDEDTNSEFLKNFEFASANIGKHRHVGKFMWLGQDKRWIEATKIIHQYIEKQVQEAIASRKTAHQSTPLNEANEMPRYTLLKRMADLTDDRLDLRHQILHVFLPGHESTGIVLGSAFFELARRPESWEKLRHEVFSTSKDEPTYEEIKSMKYLRWVLNESKKNPCMMRITHRKRMLIVTVSFETLPSICDKYSHRSERHHATRRRRSRR